MADGRKTEETNAAAKATGDGGPPYTTLPSGVVVDKDGKPCRACNSKMQFSNFMKGISKPESTSSKSATTAIAKPECPPDVEQLGRSTWTLLHSIAAQYPSQPSASQQSDLLGFMKLFSKLYPCWVCADDFRGYIAKNEPVVESRGKFGLWLCGAHNEVNRKLGKKEFDCGKWEERWRTGPSDGSCD